MIKILKWLYNQLNKAFNKDTMSKTTKLTVIMTPQHKHNLSSNKIKTKNQIFEKSHSIHYYHSNHHHHNKCISFSQILIL